MQSPTFSSLTLTLQNFISVFSGGYDHLRGSVHGLLGILVTLELVLFGLFCALGHGDNPASVMKKILHIGAWVWISESYPTLLEAFIQSLVKAGLLAGGGPLDSGLLMDPSRIAGYGLDATEPLTKQLQSIHAFTDPVGLVVFVFGYIAIMACFLLMAIQVFLAVLEYYLFAAVVGILLPFGLLHPTKFLAEKAIGAVVSAGIKLMVLAFLLSVFDPVLKGMRFQATPTAAAPTGFWGVIQGGLQANEIGFNNLWSVVLTVSALAFFCWKAPSLAASLLAGSPHLSAGEVVQTGRMGAQMAAAGVGAVGAVAGAAVSAGRTALAAGVAMRDHVQGLSEAHMTAQSGGAQGTGGGGGNESGGSANSGRSGASSSLVQSAMGNGVGGGTAGASASGIRQTPGAQSGAAGSSPSATKGAVAASGAAASGVNAKTPAPASGTRSVGGDTIGRARASGDTARAASLSRAADKPGAPAPSPEKDPS